MVLFILKDSLSFVSFGFVLGSEEQTGKKRVMSKFALIMCKELIPFVL